MDLKIATQEAARTIQVFDLWGGLILIQFFGNLRQ
jgi:hypothetical protein